MSNTQKLGKTVQLSNCQLTRVDLDTEHHYFVGNDYYLSLTKILDLAAPFPEGLKNWLRNTDGQESLEYMNMTKDRGSKLHRALEELFLGWELTMAEYPTKYEREAIVSFIRTMRFLQPKEWRTEIVVADPKLKVAGTLDLWFRADKRRLDILLEPTKHLRIANDNFELKNPLEGKPQIISAIIDYKFAARNAYNHKVQVAGYKKMFNDSYKNLPKATRAYTWRYSATHKNKFDMQESRLRYSSFKRIYETCLDYLGKYPEPPELVVYPDTVRLFKETKNGR